MVGVSVPWVLLLAACQDYNLSHLKTNPGVETTTTSGYDDTGDSLSFPCEEAGVMALQVNVNEQCGATVKTGELQTKVAWSISSFGEYFENSQVLTAPMIGNLTDDNGDGAINENDIPDIVVVADDGDLFSTHGVVHIVSGDGQQEVPAINQLQWQSGYQVHPYRYASVALGDIDNDHIPDIVTIAEVMGDIDPGGDTAPPAEGDDTGVEVVPVDKPPENDKCRVVAFGVDGVVKWVGMDAALQCAGHVPAIADLEGDGSVEVLVGPVILEGADGAVRSEGVGGTGRYAAFTEVGYISVASDLDGDGIQELVAGQTLYAPDGTIICEVSAFTDGFPAVADLDLDGEGEVVLVGNGRIQTYRDDCRPLNSWDLDGVGNGGPPTIADFDGDGTPEIGVATDTSYAVYEANGTRLWSMPVVDASSFTTGSSVFDFDGDGRAEVVYGDETSLWIFDGATGAVRLQDPFHTSRTLHEYPTIADVNGDGEADIVVPQGGGHYGVENQGLYVLSSANHDWQYAPPVWNQHAYSITNIERDLSVPSPPSSNWPDHNNFRSGDINPVSGGAAVDVVPFAVVCDETCADGFVGLMVRLGNQGLADVRSDVAVSVYTETAGQRMLLQTRRSRHLVRSGEVSDTLSFRLDPAVIPDGVLIIRVDDNGGFTELNECYEDNNELRLEDVGCD